MATILVVDDARTIRTTVAEFLRDAGYTVHAADNARDGLRLAAAHDIDVVLSDIVMPEMTGIDLLQELRRQSPRSLVIMMTGLPTVETAAEAVRAGAFDYLCKPVGKDDILRVVNYAVRLKETEDERLRLEQENEEYREHLEELVEQRTNALRESEERYRRLVQHSPIGIAVVNDDKLIFANQALARMLQTDVDALTGKAFQPFVASACRPVVAELLARVLRDRKSAERSDVLFEVGENRRLTIRMIAIPLTYGNLPAVQIVCVDETESRELQRQLQQAQRLEAIGRLAGGVAHDFNNLLTVILGEAQLLDLLSEDETARRKTSEIIHAAERASMLTRQLLAFSRKQEAEPRVLDLNQVIRDVGKMLGRLLGENIRISYDFGENIGLIRADPGQLEQVLMNLAVNARDAMPDGGHLRLSTSSKMLGYEAVHGREGVSPGKFVILTVQDSGCGMDPQTLEHIFEPFFTTKNKEEGTGLGLATVYGIVRQARGFIEVESRVGAGSSFSIYIPACIEVEKPKDTPKSKGDIPHGSETILVVEDDKDLLAAETEFLELYGYRVIPAENGQEAFSICRQRANEIDFFLLDVVLPDMNGVQLLNYLRQYRPDAKVLFVSGYTSKHAMLAKMLERDENYMQKPFSPSRLVHRIRQILDAPKL